MRSNCLAVFLFSVTFQFGASLQPQCKKTCTDGYCESSCYSNEQNLLCKCETIPGGIISCSGPSCTNYSMTEIKDVSDCQQMCKQNSCDSFIHDYNSFGGRCRFLDSCLTMEDAHVPMPCTDCTSGRTCNLCPQFHYNNASTAVHWVCTTGNPYDNKLEEGTICEPVNRCDGTPDSIVCASGGSSDEGVWQTAMDSAVDPAKVDTTCDCPSLRVPTAPDTNMVCTPILEIGSDGSWHLNYSHDCNLMCDGSGIANIKCGFSSGEGTSWKVRYDGSTIELTADVDCFACSVTTCTKGNSGIRFGSISPLSLLLVYYILTFAF